MNRYSMTNKLALAILASWLGTACADPVTDDNEARTVSVTAVHLHADGTQTVEETAMTYAQFEVLAAVRRGDLPPDPSRKIEQATVRDPVCAGPSLWLFDAANNMLCLFGAGWADLWSFPHGTGKWADQVRAYWPGTEDGYMYDRTSDLPGFESFTAGQPKTLVNGGSHHDTVVLTD